MRQLFMRRPDLDNLPPLPPLPPGYDLRPASSADEQAIAATMISAFGPEWSVDKVRRELQNDPSVVETIVATVGGVPVATASVRLMPETYPGSGYVHWVGTDAAHRGQRLGYAVTLAVLHRFRDLDCRDAVLETDPFRLPAIRVYLNLGFVPEQVVPEHEAAWREVLAALDAPREA